MVRRRDKAGSLWTVRRSAGAIVVGKEPGQGGGAILTNKSCLRRGDAMAADGSGQDAAYQKQLATGWLFPSSGNRHAMLTTEQ